MPPPETDSARSRQPRPTAPAAQPSPVVVADPHSSLVGAARDGDLTAWEDLYRELFDSVYRHICYLTGDPATSEDLVHDAFGRAMVSIESFSGSSRFTTWLHGIATNVARMHLRRAGAERRAHDALERVAEIRSEASSDALDRSHLQSRRLKVLYAVLDTLPDHLREVFILRELLAIPGAEAADQLGITPGNVAVRVHRARARIRDELERLGWVSEEGSE